MSQNFIARDQFNPRFDIMPIFDFLGEYHYIRGLHLMENDFIHFYVFMDLG